jgi:hypothetical protein
MDAPGGDGKERAATPAPGRPSFTRLAILLGVALVVILLCIPHVDRARPVAYEAAAMATLSDLTRALDTYAADFGTYPKRPGVPLVGDTTLFVDCLKRPGPKGTPYYYFREEDLDGGKYLNPRGAPYCYSFPIAGLPGPDGRIHEGVGYYLWTRSCKDTGPGAAWAINNWSR